jgi:hypothetical protein
MTDFPLSNVTRAHKRVNSKLPSQRVNASSISGMQVHDSQAWSPEFEEWATSECAWNHRALASIHAIHDSFVAWCIGHGSVPCRRDTFHALLMSEGFVLSGDLVAGLTLKADEGPSGRQGRSQSPSGRFHYHG